MEHKQTPIQYEREVFHTPANVWKERTFIPKLAILLGPTASLPSCQAKGAPSREIFPFSPLNFYFLITKMCIFVTNSDGVDLRE